MSFIARSATILPMVWQPEAGQNLIWQAAETPRGAATFIERRNGGLETLGGRTRGLKLSGGERQRLAIARAFTQKRADPGAGRGDIFSLDSEGRSGDPGIALMRLMEDRTVIAIAHRLSTIVGMDRLAGAR